MTTDQNGAATEKRDHREIVEELLGALEPLRFGPPVTHVYNPLIYARKGYDRYAGRYGAPPREILLVGMNPGPWGMAQTGVPFGDVAMVRDWLSIETAVARPEREHPRRPVMGFDCDRNEVSGRRLWGWARDRFGTPERFFDRFFVINYCPLVFMEESGRNRTPDKLPKGEREPLLDACDRFLRQTVEFYRPEFVVGVGAFAEKRAALALSGTGAVVGRLPHPSPANPTANRGWSDQAEKALSGLGVDGF